MAQINLGGFVYGAPGGGFGSGNVDGQNIAPASVTTPTISSPAGGKVDFGSSPFGSDGNLRIQSASITIDSRYGVFGGVANNPYASNATAGISFPAPGVIAVGNGTPGDASGTVQALDFIAGRSVVTSNISLSSGTRQFQVDYAPRLTWTTMAMQVLNSAGNPGDAFLGNLTASGTASIPNITSPGNLYLNAAPGGHIELTTNAQIDGNLTASGPIKPGNLPTLASLPTANTSAGEINNISNPASGKAPLVISDNTNWLYLDGSIARNG